MSMDSTRATGARDESAPEPLAGGQEPSDEIEVPQVQLDPSRVGPGDRTAPIEAGVPILAARRVTKRFGGLIAVREVDFEIPARSIVSLIGPNGAGKTTFFNVVAGIIDPTAGSVEFRGRQMVARPVRTWLEPIVWVLPAVVAGLVGSLLFGGNEAAAPFIVLVILALLIVTLLLGIIRPPWYQRMLTRLGIFRSARPNDMVVAGIGRTFQNIRLFQNMTALENVLVGMHIKMKAGMLDAMFSTPRKRREEEAGVVRARELLELTRLTGREDELAKNLPYGDQRRLEVARALAGDPALLLLDEPTAGMNPRETAEMTELISRLRNELGLTVLLIEHDMRVVMGISDRITVLDHGERIAEGTPEEIRRDPRVIEAYLGAAPA